MGRHGVLRRHGISYTMTLAIVGTVLMISAVIVAVSFNDQLGNITDLLGGQQDQSDADFCEQRIESFCRDQSDGTSWTQRYPECAEWEGQIDTDGSCPVTPPGG